MFRRGEVWYFRLETRSRSIIRSTGLTQKVQARDVAETAKHYGPTGLRDWLLIDALADGRLSPVELHDAHQAGKVEVDALRARLTAAPVVAPVADPDVTPYIDGWLRLAAANANPNTLARYRTHLRRLMPEGQPFLRSKLTKNEIEAWYAGLTVTSTHTDLSKRATKAATRSTQRKYLAAVSSFCSYLVTQGVLEGNPLLSMKWPKAVTPRCRYIELAEIEALVAAQPEPWATFSLLLHATGMEVSVAAGLHARDFDFSNRSIHARGTKASARDRVVFVAKWAWPRIAKLVQGLAPGDPVFPRVDRWRSRDAHNAACEQIGLENYRQHDARHSYAVRAIKAGASFEHVAVQLGHTDTQMVVKVYGRFHPSQAERIAWEDRATAQDKAQAKGRRGRESARPTPAKGGRSGR